jgi:Zn-dependent protease
MFLEASIVLLFRSLKIGRVAGFDVSLHWTMWFLPVFILVRGLFLYPADEALLQTVLVFGVYVCLVFHEFGKVMMARCLELPIRDIVLYPIGGTARLTIVSERPWKEIWVAAAGPMMDLLVCAALSGGFWSLGLTLSPHLDTTQPYAETFFNRLFWLNVLLAIVHVVPAFPMDGGRIFRGALALSAQRFRATEVAAMLSSFIAILFLVAGMIWIGTVWWLIPMGIIIHLSGQQELMSVRYFSWIQDPAFGSLHRSPEMVPVDQLFDEDSYPREANFSGLVWNPRNRLWIVWRNGHPVSANALVGERG